jgi:hypothetical protein
MHHTRCAQVKVDAVNPNATAKPVIIWRNPRIGSRVFTRAIPTAGDPALVAAAAARNVQIARKVQIKDAKPLREWLG